MRFIGITVLIVFIATSVENRMLPINYETEPPILEAVSLPDFTINDNSRESSLGFDAYNSKENEEFDFEIEGKISNERSKKPCAIVVLSNIQNPNMQSLLRKYRYDANGDLIPNSVKYFMKLPQGVRSSPVLVPLNDKAFSPLGGFVRVWEVSTFVEYRDTKQSTIKIPSVRDVRTYQNKIEYYKEVPPIPQAW